MLAQPRRRLGATLAIALFALAISALAETPPSPRMVRAEAPARLRVVVPSNLPVLADLQSTDAPLGEIPNVFPDALALGQTRAAPEAGAAPASTLVTLGRGATDATFPTIDVRFDTVTDGWTPPDPVMAAGPNHVVVLINARIAIYDTAGTLVQGPFSLEQFFGIPPEFFDFDPLAIWDPHSRRFIVATLSDRSASNDSRLYVAFSQTENATGAWNTYFIDADRDQPNIWADYASVGIDRNAVYFTANMFSRSNAFRNVTLFIYDKEDGYAGRPLDNVHLIDVRTQGGGSPFRLRPAWMGEVVAGDPFFLAHVSGSFTTSLDIFRLTGDRFTNPALSARTVALPEFFFGPGSARQPGGGGVSTLGGSLWNVHYRNGRLWTAHAISRGTGIAAWVHRVDVRNLAPVREQTYEILEADKDLYFPYVLPDREDNDFALLSAFSSATDLPTGRYWNVAADGTVRQTELLRGGVLNNNSSRHGDYFAIGEDPDDPHRLWMIGQYMRRSSSFGGDPVVASVRFEEAAAAPEPPPVPDGASVPGTPLGVTKSAGANVSVTWDATTCAAGDYHLVWYDLAQIASYSVAEETCAVGSSGSWTGIPPGGSVGVIAVGRTPASSIEGSHGRNSSGVERPSTANTCATAKSTAGECVP